MPTYTDQELEAVRQAANIVDVVSDFVELKKKGVNHTACCPFHQEKTPSFVVSESKGIFKCFGCGESGDAFTFLMQHESMTFIEAVQYIAKKNNITLSEGTEEEETNYKKKLQLFSSAKWVASHYYDSFKLHPKRNEIIDYLKERGLNGQTVKDFQIGYAYPENALAAYTKKAKRNIDDMIDLGLLKEDKLYHIMRNRIMFPIRDTLGNYVGFGGRAMEKQQQPKYLNSPDSIAYIKRNVLYGLYEAKTSIRSLQNVYLVEGYFDVVALVQNGVPNVVANCGTAFTPEQAKLIKRFSKKITICYDSDKAGQKATKKAIEVALQANLEVEVIRLEEGQDPADFANIHKENSNKELEKRAVPFADYLVYKGMDTTEIKEVCQMLSHIDKLEAETYLQRISLLTNIQLKTLLSYLKSNKKNNQVLIQEKQKDSAEEVIIALLACFAEVEDRGKSLAAHILDELEDVPFETDFGKQIRIIYENQVLLGKPLHYSHIIMQLKFDYQEKFIYFTKKYKGDVSSKKQALIDFAFRTILEFKMNYCDKQIKDRQNKLPTSSRPEKETLLGEIKGFQTLNQLLIKELNEAVCKTKKEKLQTT